MIFTIDQYLTLAEAIKHELAPLEKKKEINLIKSEWGGHGFVDKVLAIADWWKKLSEDWRDKILRLPFKLIKQDGWVTLTQLSEDKLSQWFDGINAKLEKQGRLLASDLKRVATPLLPVKPKSTLKLGEAVTDDDFEIVGRKFRFEENDLENFKNTVLEHHGQKKFLTEQMFYYLELVGCDPLGILAKTEKTKWLLLQKDKEIEAERSLRIKLEKQFKQELRERLEEQAQYLAKITVNPVTLGYKAVNPNSIVFDEERIKVSIQRLINQEAFSLTALSSFMKGIIESDLPDQYWHKIFDEFGASMALKQEICPPMIIKLLTLRCLAIPETQKPFMSWISQNSSPLIAKTYNSFREKLLRNISSLYGKRFDLFRLDQQGKPIANTFSTESYQVFINGEINE
ncbi:MAG: hypothetical protein QNJ33_07690 [Crocosphaera sp.]|nr:hypothetical protein [Crocosphaera sp.]